MLKKYTKYFFFWFSFKYIYHQIFLCVFLSVLRYENLTNEKLISEQNNTSYLESDLTGCIILNKGSVFRT